MDILLGKVSNIHLDIVLQTTISTRLYIFDITQLLISNSWGELLARTLINGENFELEICTNKLQITQQAMNYAIRYVLFTF